MLSEKRKDNSNEEGSLMKKQDFIRKFTSRKLWMSIASFVSMLLVFFGYAENKATQVAALIMAGATVIGYVIGEGLADFNSTYIPETDEAIEYIDEDEDPEENEEND
jgi:hypothetical protein